MPHDMKAIDKNWTLNQNKCLYQASTLYKSLWEYFSVLFVWYLSTIKLRACEHWSEGKSEFPSEFNTKLVHKASQAYQITFNLLPSCKKRFTTKGKQTLSHFLEKLLITKAIYQLNKYNKAWLNTNLTKTPTLYFSVEFQELLQIFWETYRFNSPKFFTFTCIDTLRLQKMKQDFSRVLRQNPPGHWVKM